MLDGQYYSRTLLFTSPECALVSCVFCACSPPIRLSLRPAADGPQNKTAHCQHKPLTATGAPPLPPPLRCVRRSPFGGRRLFFVATMVVGCLHGASPMMFGAALWLVDLLLRCVTHTAMMPPRMM